MLPVIQRYAYVAHPENKLLSMVTDERSPVREIGWRKTLKARNKNKSAESVRDFSLPTLNDNVDDKYQMIDWI